MPEDPTRRDPDDALDEALSALLDGELTAEEAARVRAAVAASPEAARRLERMGLLDDALRALPAPQVPEELHARLRARIAATAPGPRPARQGEARPRGVGAGLPGGGRSGRRTRLAWVAGAALATAAGGALWIWLPRGLVETPRPGREAARVGAPDDPVEEFLAAAPPAPAAAPDDDEVIELLDWLAELGDVEGGRG